MTILQHSYTSAMLVEVLALLSSSTIDNLHDRLIFSSWQKRKISNTITYSKEHYNTLYKILKY